MQNTTILPELDLQLFDGAAAAPAAGGETGGQQGQEGALPKAETKGRSGGSRRSNAGDFKNVVFGRQGDAPAAGAAQAPDAGGQNAEGSGKHSGVETTSNTLEEKRKAFDEMISGEYKDVYTEKFNSYFNRRFKEAKGLEDSLNAQKPIMDMLMQRYGIENNDIGKLQTALEDDSAYWGEAAEEAGMTVEQYKQMQKLERENAHLKQMQDRQEGERQANEQLAQWYKQGEEVKQLYPTFDLRTEATNRDFLGLLHAGVSVKQAYELMHMEEIKAAAAKTAAQTAGQQMAAKIQSKAARPAENGTSSQSAVIVKNDVHNLTRAERAEIARRVQRGENIRF